MEHLINYPVDIIDTNEDIEDDVSLTVLECLYHRGFKKMDRVSVFIHDTKLRGVVVDSNYYGGCYLVSIRIVESFRLRMVEQVIRIETSGLTPAEWVSRYGKDFPER